MENCGNCHRGLVQGEVCGECKGTMFVTTPLLDEEISNKIVDKAVRIYKKTVGKKK